jgi:hypothetical protein
MERVGDRARLFVLKVIEHLVLYRWRAPLSEAAASLERVRALAGRIDDWTGSVDRKRWLFGTRRA